MAQDNVARGLVLNGPRVLAQSAAAVSHTGDTSETTLASVTVPANAIGIDGRIEFKARFTFTNNANNKTINTKLGSTTFHSRAFASVANGKIEGDIANRAAANSQVGSGAYMTGSAAGNAGATTGAEDSTGALTFAITTTNASASDTTTLESYQVLIYPKP